MIQVYNSLTRTKEVFKPIVDGQIKMYVCGPTVYNYIHIGNARSAVAFDTIRRYFEYRGYQVNYVSNFTDVDDKIIRVANETGKTAQAVASYYIEAYRQDTAQLNILPATTHPQVIDNIPEIIEFITSLIDKEYAYISQGDVYYRTRKFKDYGQLSDKSIDELESGASQRTGNETSKKEDPLDFALWKSAKENEVFWEAPWGAGRPGWHIECSVMVNKYLGDTIDIHGGGQDLEFPHHENEIAQSEAKTGHPFVHYWLHNGFVTSGSEKMSKSLGNFVTLRELLETVPGEVIRFALATTQYRRPLPFNDTMIKEADVNLKRIKTALQNNSFRKKQAVAQLASDKQDLAELERLEAQFIIEMDDDFNTANGITVVYELVKWLNQYNERPATSQTVAEKASQLLLTWLAIFGIEFKQHEDILASEIDALLAERQAARERKDFARSDEIRDMLTKQGIILEDTAQGTRWRRTE